MSFPFSRKISPPPNQESKEHFSLVSAEALRGCGGTVHSFSFRSKKVRANAKITPLDYTIKYHLLKQVVFYCFARGKPPFNKYFEKH